VVTAALVVVVTDEVTVLVHAVLATLFAYVVAPVVHAVILLCLLQWPLRTETVSLHPLLSTIDPKMTQLI